MLIRYRNYIRKQHNLSEQTVHIILQPSCHNKQIVNIFEHVPNKMYFSIDSYLLLCSDQMFLITYTQQLQNRLRTILSIAINTSRNH